MHHHLGYAIRKYLATDARTAIAANFALSPFNRFNIMANDEFTSLQTVTVEMKDAERKADIWRQERLAEHKRWEQEEDRRAKRNLSKRAANSSNRPSRLRQRPSQFGAVLSRHRESSSHTSRGRTPEGP
ncbi:hypothetical protein LWS69_02590 [Bordetella hinzii]|nr:hypothetical protein [Bordetella hinzii]